MRRPLTVAERSGETPAGKPALRRQRPPRKVETAAKKKLARLRRLLAAGRTQTEIAKIIGWSYKTTNTYVNRIKRDTEPLLSIPDGVSCLRCHERHGRWVVIYLWPCIECLAWRAREGEA